MRSDLRWVWDAFWQLASCRQFGMRMGPIPWSATVTWAERYSVRDVGRFVYLIERMDGVMLSDIENEEVSGG